MPVDRLLHPCIGDSEKIAKLTDMEFRVWIAYLLAADDWGVLPMLAAKVQAIDRTLANRRRQQIDRALGTLVSVGLVRCFDHQGQVFMFSRGWQTYQKIKHPRRSHFPKPPDSLCQLCDSLTRTLFEQHNGPMGSVVSGDFSENISPEIALAHAGGREEANGLRLQANGNGLRLRFEKFWTAFPKKVGKDAAWREWLHRSPSDDLTNQIIAKVQAQRGSKDWLKDGGQYIPHPRTWLHQGRWQDEDGIPREAATVADDRGHIPPCRSMTECTAKALAEGRAKASAF